MFTLTSTSSRLHRLSSASCSRHLRTRKSYYSSKGSQGHKKYLEEKYSGSFQYPQDVYDPSLAEDPRPPWLFRTTNLLRVVFIPTAIFYAVFYYDFGPGEHVFSPARRWIDERKAAFLSLTPEEKGLVDRTRNRSANGSSEGKISGEP